MKIRTTLKKRERFRVELIYRYPVGAIQFIFFQPLRSKVFVTFLRYFLF